MTCLSLMYLQSEGETETHLLGHFSNGCNGQAWARSKLRMGCPFQVSQGPDTWTAFLFAQAIGRELSWQ